MSLDGKAEERRYKLDLEFKEILDFHNESFTDLDRKAQYWLTITLPTFITILGIILERELELSLHLLSGGSALVFCLLVSIYFLSAVMRCKPVLSGRLKPPKDGHHLIDTAISSTEGWEHLRELQTKELLKAIHNNETTNEKKSQALKRGEATLFLASPIAVLLAGCAAFAHTATSPLHGAGATVSGTIGAGVAIGITAGLAAITGTLAANHR